MPAGVEVEGVSQGKSQRGWVHRVRALKFVVLFEGGRRAGSGGREGRVVVPETADQAGTRSLPRVCRGLLCIAVRCGGGVDVGVGGSGRMWWDLKHREKSQQQVMACMDTRSTRSLPGPPFPPHAPDMRARDTDKAWSHAGRGPRGVWEGTRGAVRKPTIKSTEGKHWLKKRGCIL